MISTATNLDYLIGYVRVRIGDVDPTRYKYTDEWIRTSLVAAVNTLGLWWNFKYLLDTDYNIYRNPNGYFIFPEDTFGIIEPADEQTICMMAHYIMLEGSLENSAWDYASWKDYEISFSNLESARTRTANLNRLWNQIMLTIKPPQKRLARPIKGSLPGYLNNPYERNVNDKG